MMNQITEYDWAPLVASLGRNPGDFSVIQRWNKIEPRGIHEVLRIESSDMRLICKVIHHPADLANFTGIVSAQERAHRALAAHPNSRVPEVLASDPAGRAILMRYVTGPSLLSLSEVDPMDLGPIRAAGRWLDAFHRAGPLETRAYQPRFMTDHLVRLMRAVVLGTEPIAEPEEFLASAERLIALADQVQGAETRSSHRHGDAKLCNILIGETYSWGIDIAPLSTGPVGFDIARLLVDWAELYSDVGTLAPGQLLPAPISAAFFGGYTLVAASDASLRFLLPMRLISNWRSLPATVDAMSVADLIRLQRIRQLIGHLLPE